MKRLTSWIMLVSALLLAVACEKPNLDDDNNENHPEDKNSVKVTFRLTGFDMTDFTTQSRASHPISELCTHIDVAAYSSDGTRVTKVAQKSTNEGFGTVTLTLPTGKYRIVALAHSCTGSATTTDVNKITFPNNKVTDTFYYCSDIDVTAATQKDIEMHRAVAAFCLVVKAKTPETVKQMKFLYTGGSSTFDGINGVGNVNSRQTEIRDVESSAYTGESRYMIYTFPHSDLKPLKIVVTALDASGNTIKEQTFEDVPIKVNQITQYTGDFFSGQGGSTANSNLSFFTNDEWTTTETTY